MSEDIDVRDDPEESRYEIFAGGAPAGFARYVRRGRRTFFVHTEVDPRFEGQGLGSRLAGGALDHERAAGTAVVPLCPFIRSYIERHPEVADLVDTEMLAEIDSE